MIFTIPIDRTSIRKNPNAGKQIYQIPGKTMNIVEVVGKDEINGPWIKRIWKDGILIYKGIPDIPKSDYKVSFSQSYQELNTLIPEPDFLYEHKDATVECKYCFSKFNYKLLKTDWAEYYYDNIPYDTEIRNICPSCNKEDCCEIEFEKL